MRPRALIALPFNYILVTLVVLGPVCKYAAAETQTHPVHFRLQQFDPDLNLLNYEHASISTRKDASGLLQDLLPRSLKRSGHDFDSKSLTDRNFYCVIHVLRWDDPSNGRQVVKTENWYLYWGDSSQTDDNFRTIHRLYGVKHVFFVYIHLNRQLNYDGRYEFGVAKRTPAYLTHAFGLIDLWQQQEPKKAAATPQCPDCYFGAEDVPLDYVPSDILIGTLLRWPTDNEASALTAKGKYDNEGKYYIDFSVGVPIRRMRDIQFDSVNGTVNPKQIDSQNIFALLNIFPIPVDASSTSTLIPHAVTGVSISRKPLDRILVAGALGLTFGQLYLGAAFVKEDQLNTLSSGSSATPAQLASDRRRRYHAQVAFGINLPVGGVIEALKKKSK